MSTRRTLYPSQGPFISTASVSTDSRKVLDVIGAPVETDGDSIVMSRSLEANLHRYQLYENILRGGDSMILPPAGTLHPITGGSLPDGTYLTRLPAEGLSTYRGRTVDTFQARVNNSAHHPIVTEILGIYVSTLFRQQIDRSRVRDLVGDDIYRDIDLRGTSADQWLAAIHMAGLASGAIGAVVDYPTASAKPASRMHETAQGHRPYVATVPVTRIWQYIQGVVAVIQRGDDLFRVWTPTAFADITKSGKILRESTHTLGDIPLELYVAQDPPEHTDTAPLGQSAIRDSALIQIQYDDHASLLEALQRKTNFPFLHIQDDPPSGDAADDTVLGPDFALYQDAIVGWVSPPPTCAQEAREHLDRLEGRVYKTQGVHRRSQDSVEAHSGLALDYESSPIYATVQAWAQRLRVFEERIWRRFAHLLGKTVEGDLVSYPEDFSTRPIDLELAQAEQVTKIYGGYSSAPKPVQMYVDEKLKRAMERDLSALPVVQTIAASFAAIDYDGDEEPAEAEPPQNDEEEPENG